ncbi:MAG: hypothetical protein QOH84_3894 [Kribbellaceae bacterium]|jgi:hypothetical protein|nr:hypothetical protein [Kribbellaceae bacterium]
MDRNHFMGITKAVFAQSPHGSGDLLDRIIFTNDGVLASGGEQSGKLGFGVAGELTPSPELLSKVGDVNRLMGFGHYWLAPGSTNDNWSLVGGFKFPYDLCADDFVIEMGIAMVNHSSALIGAVREQIAHISHRPYWLPDSSPDAQAIVLMSHLG